MLSHEDYLAALDEASALISDDPAPDSNAGRRLIELVALIEAYESKHFFFEPATPAELAAYRRAEREKSDE